MAGSAKQKRATKRRKERQREVRELAALRLEVRNYEGVGSWAADRMSAERCREIIRRGKRRRGLTGAPLGLTMAMVAAAAAGRR